MITVERAIALAAEAHAGALDRGDQPYILHPLRVMLAQDSDEARIVAVFHDVLEDVEGWDADRLRAEGFTEAMVEALEALTKRPEEKSFAGYMLFIRRVASNSTATKVKLADLRDNLDRSRIEVPTSEDNLRWKKYDLALSYLQELSGIDAAPATEAASADWWERMQEARRNPKPIDPAEFQKLLAENEQRELEQGRNRPKMMWPEE